MKTRSVILIVLLVSAFVYLTSFSNFRGTRSLPLAKIWRQSPLRLTDCRRAAGLSPKKKPIASRSTNASCHR